jgi:methyl-accepting chemotaxis protein
MSILLMTSLISGVKGAANLEIVYVFVSPEKPKTYEPTVIEVAILNHEGSGQYYDLILVQTHDIGYLDGQFVDWDGHIAMFSGYANPYGQTRMSFIISPIVAGRVKLSLTLRDAFTNVVDTWEEVITIEKGDLETEIDSIDSNMTSIKNSLDSLSSTINSLSSTINSLNSKLNQLNSTLSSQEVEISTLQGSLEATRNALAVTQIGSAIAIIIVSATFFGLLYYLEKLKKQRK